MNNITAFCVFLVLCGVVQGQQRKCESVNGKRRRCIPITECQPLSAIVRNTNRTEQDIKLLKSSHCGFKDNVPNVCCPWAPGDKCYTPEGKLGKCVGLKSCRHLQRLLLPPLEKHKIIYVERSKCEGSDQYSVCCGPVPDLGNVQKGKCESKLSAFPPDPATECCGVDSSINNKIFGGNVTRIDQYPWLAIIEFKKNDEFRILCIGALISSRYVVSAAHCIHGLDSARFGKPETIRLGEFDTRNDGPDCVEVERGGRDCTAGVTRILIQSIIPHPEHDDQLHKNDIALIRMAEAAPFTDFIRPICLTRTNVTRKTSPFNLAMAGWAKFEKIKTHVELPFVNRFKCQEAFQTQSRRSNLTKSHICAGGETDKGGCTVAPLMYENDGTYELVGISSFGPTRCGVKDVPDVFTNIYEYHPWIRSNIVP